ncbi:MAG: 16S rRNA (guanine(527)-N(7))-methyltransferase RsmG [PS1 clade bacterium]|nr:16S rRNA (guanine(527)-N(7))-methyltransferase RsmG [PS1 clade bacterium]MBL6784107.1 16S rRNA (guanine(527)-N(7))-methyltransferase RsmG [PS1 clade bacterium]
MTPEQFAETYDVSRETLTKLMAYQALLGKWQKSVNLVGPNTLAHFWQRHAADSAQIMRYAPSTSTTPNAAPKAAPNATMTWLDLGSGGGLPGLVLAIMLAEKNPAAHMHFIESDRKKAGFLRAVIADTGLTATVHHARIEAVAAAKPPALAAIDVITARALAPLPDLLGLLAPFCNSSTVALVHKGRNWQEELTAIEQYWKLNVTAQLSDTDAAARILEISAVTPRNR